METIQVDTIRFFRERTLLRDANFVTTAITSPSWQIIFLLSVQNEMDADISLSLNGVFYATLKAGTAYYFALRYENGTLDTRLYDIGGLALGSGDCSCGGDVSMNELIRCRRACGLI